MMAGFLSLLVPHFELVATRRRAGAGGASAGARAAAEIGTMAGMELHSPPVPAATFSEYEYADNQLAVYSSSIVLDYRAAK